MPLVTRVSLLTVILFVLPCRSERDEKSKPTKAGRVEPGKTNIERSEANMSSEIGILRKLPPQLAYLAEPAMTFGIHQFDDDIDRFLANASDAEMSALAAVAEHVRLNNHYPAVNDWLDEYEIDRYEEAANLYFLFHVMDAADLNFEGT